MDDEEEDDYSETLRGLIGQATSVPDGG